MMSHRQYHAKMDEILPRHFSDSLFPSCSMLDSSHGEYDGMDQGMTPLDKQRQYFGTVKFPVTEETEAWKEKVSTTK